MSLKLSELFDILDRLNPEDVPKAKHDARTNLNGNRTKAQAQIALYSMIARMNVLAARYLQSKWVLNREKFLEWIETQLVVDAADILNTTIHNGIDRETLLASADKAAVFVFGSDIAENMRAYLTPNSGTQQELYFRRTDLPMESDAAVAS